MATNTAKRSEEESSGSPTSQRAAKAAHEAVDSVAARAEAAEGRIRDAAAGAQADLEDRAEATRAQGRALAGNVQTLVKEHPVAALGAAFLTGVIVSSIMRR